VALLLPVLIFAMALLYSSVGHAGASGYLAAMALFGVAPTIMKPSALVLNVLVAAIGTVQFARAGRVAWSSLGPFALGSIPLAFLGGAMHVPDRIYKPLVGLVLLFAAGRLALLTFRETADEAEARREIRRPSPEPGSACSRALPARAAASSSARSCCRRGGPARARPRGCRRRSSW
jgi:uncharacterized membrane protein YfcA